jgi:hypothetical protein
MGPGFDTSREAFLAAVDRELARLRRAKSPDEARAAEPPNVGALVPDLAGGFWDWATGSLEQGICCWGLTRIDSDEERDEVADRIVDSLGLLIPPPYSAAWPVLRPVARRWIVLPALVRASETGDAYCEGVVCDVAPFPDPRR